jgi:hypothetical protein
MGNSVQDNRIQDNIEHSLKRLNDAYEKHKDDIDDDTGSGIYWSIETLIDDIQTAGGDVYNGPSLGGTYTREDKQMDDWAREEFARK